VYENQTFDAILKRMLDRVPNDVDKREGSVIYDALAPVAAEIAQMYADLDVLMSLTFARTSSGEFLDYRTEESGVKRRPATKAVRKGVFNIDVPIGSRFRGGEVVYKVVEQIAAGEFKLEAETAGTAGNLYFGSLLPIDFVDGLTSATLADVLIPGEDAETDGELYARYVESINTVSYGGNIGQYKQWIGAIPGVGRFKLFPLWAGRGTVKAVVTDAGNNVPSPELVALVQNTIDPHQDGVGGAGLAPIGHVFTAASATPKVVNVEMEVVFREGYGAEDIRQEAEEQIDAYFSEINFVDTTVRHAVLMSRLIGLAPVQDILSLTLNGTDGNLTLAEEEIAVRGTVSIIAN